MGSRKRPGNARGKEKENKPHAARAGTGASARGAGRRERKAQSGGAGSGKKGEGKAAKDEPEVNAWTTTCANDVLHVQNLLERCLRLYMSREEVMTHLQRSSNIEPVFTRLVWDRLEKDNAEFFEAYHIMVRMKDQIIRFNTLLETYYAATRGGSPTEKVKGEAKGDGDGGASGKREEEEDELRGLGKRDDVAGSQRRGLGNWDDVAGSPIVYPGVAPSGLFMNLSNASPFPDPSRGSTGLGLPKTPFSGGMELNADEMLQLMITPSMGLNGSELHKAFESHMAAAGASGTEYDKHHLPTEFTFDDIPDFSLSPHAL